ncbi:unnamed protein product [Rotaria magnacalcarata]|uniref:TIR domain-containing protein n=2 Tax=Rotaria magnacalcarata TaxID=392030 RepID=A0A816MH49_9BILA|nr:unnamed protein product [Rotaria magnacalcarata]CAF4163949.1 unnamed protein product [Rotaria magnacalcarata]
MSGSSIIDQQCLIIKEHEISCNIEQLKKCFDTIVSELNKIKFPINIKAIQKISTSITIDDTNPYNQSDIVNHPLFIIIRDCFINILHQWRTDQRLEQSSRTAFSEVAVMFAIIGDYVTDINVNVVKQLLIYKPLIDELNECLMEIATHGKYLQDFQIDAVDFMIRAIHRLSRRRLEIQNDALLEPLLDVIVKCVCSPFFFNIFMQITELKDLNEAQTFLLNTCTDYIAWHEGNRRHAIYSVIRTALLKPFTQWFQSHVATFQQWNELTNNAIDKQCAIMFDFGFENDEMLSSDTCDDCKKLIDGFIFILSSLSNSTTNTSSIDLIGICMFHLYAMTLEQNLLDYIKSRQLSAILLKLIDIGNEEMQFNAYRILASIMTEQDIKMLANPSKIANVFFTFLVEVIDNSRKIRRLRNLLRCLKSLVQHDQIKEDLIKEGILPQLIRCATEIKFDPLKEQQPALEILLAMTFNSAAATSLKQNSQFISHLKTLLISSPEQGVRRAVEGLIWKLEKEDTATANSAIKSTTQSAISYKYDIMLSYSHSDKDLCYRLHDRLTNDHFRVWLDREQMHGATMVAMADAIENSQFVLICMSDAYKQSAYCQSEAHYAYERRCHLIPIIMKPNYRPDGWLGFTVSGKIYVDFPKLGFDQAYLKLKNGINQQRKNFQQLTKNQDQLRSDPSITETHLTPIEMTSNNSDGQLSIKMCELTTLYRFVDKGTCDIVPKHQQSEQSSARICQYEWTYAPSSL